MARVNEAGWREGYGGILPPEAMDKIPVERWEREMRQGLREPRGSSFTKIAEIGGRVCGYTFVSAPGREEPDDSGLAELVAMYVYRRAWGKGVGTKLMEEALAGAAAAGFAEIELWTFEANARAVRFYERHGFRADGESHPFVPYGVKTIRMRRDLPGRPASSQ